MGLFSEEMSYSEAYNLLVQEIEGGYWTEDELENIKYQFDKIAPILKARDMSKGLYLAISENGQN